VESLPTKAIDYLLTNTVLGVTTILFMYIAWKLLTRSWEREAAHKIELDEIRLEIEEIYSVHATEIASLNKALYDQQERRVEELKAATTALIKFNDASLAVLAKAGI